MISVIIPNNNRMITTSPAKAIDNGKAAEELEPGEGKIISELAVTFSGGAGVGVAMLPGVMPNSIAKVSATC